MPNNKLVSVLKPLLVQIITFTAPSDKLLSECFRSNKWLSSKQRYLIAETVYSLLRNYYKLTRLADSNNIDDLISLIWLKLLKLNQESLDMVSCLDFNKFATLQLTNDTLSQMELPQWLLDELHLQYNAEEIIQIARSMQIPAKLDLRINILKTNLSQVLKVLQASNLQPQVTSFSQFAIRLPEKTSLNKHPLFLDGHIEIQDESSQLAGILLSPKRGDMVVDFCAGSGGKTLLIGMLMRNTGRIYALDINERRLNNLVPRVERSGLSNVHPQLIAHENDIKVKRLYNKIDKVFIDAPCSGLGTLRRSPELKFRQNLETIATLNAKQRSILESASKLLKPGGRLVYATCSILKSENQDIVNAFLNAHPDFKLIPAQNILKKSELETEYGSLALLPHKHQTDGFFAALLERIK